MRFKDRADAGRKLVPKLAQYKNNPDAIIIALPRGGVVTGYEVAKELSLPLDIVVPRKIGAPSNPELAVGAITEDGDIFLNEILMQQLKIEKDDLTQIIKDEKQEAQRRLSLYRGKRPPLDLKNKIAILVDDGIATGATMGAAIVSAKAKGAKKIVVAVPVAPPDTLEKIKQQVDEVICLHVPEILFGVGAFFDNFAQTEDETVIKLMGYFTSN